LIAADFLMAGKLGDRNKKCAERRIFVGSLAGQNRSHYKPPKFLMGKQI
jgi:hypothetical protein